MTLLRRSKRTPTEKRATRREAMPQALRYAIGVALWAKHNSVALKVGS
ncbi:hypothetical protein [Nostoc sp. FACHB-133]|nr:hypothetical protein [Nostoc sp. FACHB-133]MBD2524563.1 hypothetical protein [Nostoc sp. FACHB-133]